MRIWKEAIVIRIIQALGVDTEENDDKRGPQQMVTLLRFEYGPTGSLREKEVVAYLSVQSQHYPQGTGVRNL